MSFNIEVESGKSKKLLTAGKYCDRDIVITATGTGGGGIEIDPNTIIEKTLTGSLLCVKDVSEISHKCKVTANNNDTLYVLGLNLFDGQWESGGLSSKGTETIDSTSIRTGYIKVFPNTSYIFNIQALNVLPCTYKKDKTFSQYLGLASDKEYFTFTTTEDEYYIRIAQYQDTEEHPETMLYISNIVLPFEPYSCTITPVKAGEHIEIDSRSLYMTLYTENESEFEFEYHKSYGVQVADDRFWDNYQNYGDRNDYRYAFYGARWNDDNYNPKYPITCTGGTNSGSTLFDNSRITDTKVDIIATNTVIDSMFVRSSKLRTIRKLILNGVTRATSTFTSCSALENIEIVGTMYVNMAFDASKVITRKSLTSILNSMGYIEEGQTTPTLTLSEETYSMLTQEELDVATKDKKWKVAYK